MKTAALLLAMLLLSGCATTNFENRLTVTPACDRVFMVSLYWKLGVTTEISEKDLAVLCDKGPAK